MLGQESWVEGSSAIPTSPFSDGSPGPPELPGERSCVDTELGSDIGDRQPLGVAFGGSDDQGVGHFPGDAAAGHASPIELTDDRGPVDAVPPSERIDRRPLLVEVRKFIDDSRR
jgi:hypothetical protein